MKKRNIELERVRQGEVFTLDGVKFVKLDGDAVASFVITEGTPLENCPFDTEGKERNCPNNYHGSEIEKRVSEWAEKHESISLHTVARVLDLTTMDGMTDYDMVFSPFRILTIDEYRKYRRFIPLTDTPYWLATGYSTASSPYSYPYSAYCISSDGTVYNGGVYRASFAARPALYLKSSILVSIEDDEEGRSLEDYTERELLGELQRRVEK